MRLVSFVRGALLGAGVVLISCDATEAGGFQYRVYSSAQELAQVAAQEILDLIHENPEALLVLPTGSSPFPVYKELHRRFQLDRSVDFSRAQIFFWDEYAGLEAHHPLRYSHYIEEEFLRPFLGVDSQRAPQRRQVHVPFDPLRTKRLGFSEQEREEEAKAYEELFQNARQSSRHKRVDLYLLGAGGAYPVQEGAKSILQGGHIGFNEPTESWQLLPTNVSQLSLKTRKDTEFRFRSLRQSMKRGSFPQSLQTRVPEFAVTLGIQNFLDDAQGPNASRVIALLTGEAKAPVAQQIIEKGETPDFPVSIIHRASNAVILMDEDAAHFLKEQREPVSHVSARFDQRELKEAFDRSQGMRRVLIVSPHPDDDVISMAIAIKRLNEWGHSVRVVTVTSGSNSVRLDLPPDTLFSMLDEEQRSEWARRIREAESRSALKILGLNQNQSVYFDTDFYYRRGIPGLEVFTFMDEIKARDLLIRFQPTDVFYAAENDPHGAHGLAFQLIWHAARSLGILGSEGEPRLWGYRGAYSEWNFNQSGVFVLPFSRGEMDLKVRAIQQHESQMNPLFPSFDPREFYERARDRNLEAGKKWSAISGSSLPCAEVFKLLSSGF
jgi:glucosamine-6-phosphate deaminase